MAAVDFINVNKCYANSFQAVRDLNLHIDDGEFVVLVGPSGCGKSTSLRMLAGLEEASSGELRIGERRVNELQPGERDIAMVFQNYALYPHMTVRQNLQFGLKMRKTPKAEIDRRTAHVAETLGIVSLMDRRPRELSGGQRQRIALGRAIVRQPQVFLFDEPLSNLDAKLRVQMRAEIASLHRRLKTTMIYVTHDQVEAMTLGQRIVVMDQGVVQQIDEPLAIYRQPINRFVAGFIGAPPMNLWYGELSGDVFTFAHRRLSIGGAHPHQKAWLGVRPEDIVLAGSGPSLGTATLEVVEQLGYESMGFFSIAGQRAALRLLPDSGLRPGNSIEPRLRPSTWCLFADNAAGSRLDN